MSLKFTTSSIAYIIFLFIGPLKYPSSILTFLAFDRNLELYYYSINSSSSSFYNNSEDIDL